MKSGRIWTYDLENLMYHANNRYQTIADLKTKYFKYIEHQSQSPTKNLTTSKQCLTLINKASA